MAFEPAEQAGLHYRLGRLQLDDFQEPSRAMESFRQAIEQEPEHDEAVEALFGLTDDADLFEEVAEVLEPVYRSRGQTERLAALFKKRVSFAGTPEERLTMRRDLARVLEDEVGDAAQALAVLQEGLRDDPTDEDLLVEVERLLDVTQSVGAAANALMEAVEAHPELLSDVAVGLLRRVATWCSVRGSDPAGAERALKKALDYEPTNDELLREVEELQRSTGNNAALSATLRRRAKLPENEGAREDLYRQALELLGADGPAEEREQLLRELLELDGDNQWALSGLADIAEAAEQYKEALSFIERWIELGAEGADLAELRYRAAELAQHKLNDAITATGLLERIFDEDPSQARAAAALRQLYQAESAWERLDLLLERLVDAEDTGEGRNRLRVERAQLKKERLDDASGAIEILQTALGHLCKTN